MENFTEYYTVKRIDNSRLDAADGSPAQVRDFWRRVAVGAAMAACLLSYAWQHFECIQIRYQIEQLETRARAGRGAESAIAPGSRDAAFADAGGRDRAQSAGLDGSGARTSGAC